MAERPLSRVAEIARLVRLQNGAIAALGVLAGAWWAAPHAIGLRTGLAAIVAVLLAAFANTFNDIQDVEIDRVAHPDRPIPSGKVSIREAQAIAFCSALLGLAASAAASWALAAASAAVLVAMAAYSTHVKRRGIAGNLLVALLASLPFAYGAWSVAALPDSVPLLAIAIPMHFAREVAKDLDDVAGDAGARQTLPITRGAPAARGTVVGATVVSLLALLPLMLRDATFALLLVPAMMLALLAVVRVVRGARGGPVLLKSAMIAATLSLLVTRS